MKRIPKEKLDERDQLIARLEAAKSDLEQQIELLNHSVSKFSRQIEASQEKINSILAEATEFCDLIYTEMSDYFSGRSERWCDSANGESYSLWMSDWEQEFESLEIETPVEISLDETSPVDDAIDALRFLRDQPE